MEDTLTRLSRALQAQIESALSDTERKPLTPEAAKSYAAALKTLREVESPGEEGRQEIVIRMEGGSEAWKN